MLLSLLVVPVECSRYRCTVFAPLPHLSSECGLDSVETIELFRAGRRVRDFPGRARGRVAYFGVSLGVPVNPARLKPQSAADSRRGPLRQLDRHGFVAGAVSGSRAAVELADCRCEGSSLLGVASAPAAGALVLRREFVQLVHRGRR